MGCLGMSLQDFCSCTPSEFNKVYAAWHDKEMRRIREGWEQTRTICICSMQPYSKKRLVPQDVMPLPWDRDGRQKEKEPELTREERKARYEAAKKRYGIE